MRDSFGCADLDSLGNQRIHWPLIIMRRLRHDLHNYRRLSNIYHLYEAEQVGAVVCADELAAVRIRLVVEPHLRQGLTEVPEPSPLTHWGLVVDCLDSYH